MKLLSYIKQFVKSKAMLHYDLFHERYRNRFFGIRNGQAIDCFFDVGANVGAFPVKFSRNMGVTIKNVIYVEPDIRCLAPLKKIVEASLFDTARIENVCLGNANGEIELYKTENPAQNSALPPTSFKSEKSVVLLTTGDELVRKHAELLGAHNILKIDVQGLEMDVLNGFRDSLKNFAFIIIEISFEEFYKKQSSYLEIITYLSKTHSYVGDFTKVYRKDGRISYMNSCFQINDKTAP